MFCMSRNTENADKELDSSRVLLIVSSLKRRTVGKLCADCVRLHLCHFWMAMGLGLLHKEG